MLLRRVDLTTLRLFVAICEEKNLTRAAAREGIAASAVSKRLNDFEIAFGITLFARLPKGMELTPAGETLLHHARVMLLNVEKI
ncbi:MAG: LysR family transcriptional regulator, partial [Proteobacteria bacterium]|nr:LysR family transcriptional regulator [Pseudomonadota bacterium]